MTWFLKHKHKHCWRPIAVKHGTIQDSGVAGTQILQQCQDKDCGAYATQTIFGCWSLEDVRTQVPEREVAELRRRMEQR
jgi:Ulp1 family protease